MSDAATSALTNSSLFTVLAKAADSDYTGGTNVHAHEEEFAAVLEALPCPYPPEPLVRLYERSNALRPCVEAMAVNVHAFGHRLVPRIDAVGPDFNKRIAQVILAERMHAGDDEPEDPTPEEVEARKAKILRGMSLEEIRLRVFLENCNDEGFTALRLKLQTDLEITGNAYLEVVRDAVGRVARLHYCPSVNMRLRPLEQTTVKVQNRVRVSDVSFDVQEVEERPPRGFVQRVSAVRVFFKGFGDPRVISKADGRAYAAVEDLPASDGAATEIIHFAQFSSRTSYGIPRWIGAVFEVLGIEAMSQVNYLAFDNKGVPPLAIAVSGGTLSPNSAQFLENFVKTRLKGRMNYHSVLVLEALPAGGANGNSGGVQSRIAITPLAQPQDAVFLNYAERCEDVIGRQWRLSPITRGKVNGTFNRATADASMKKDEEQVFQPERQKFDERFERTILRDLGVRYHRMESNSPVASDPEAMSKILEILVKHNVLVPNEARRVASKILNTELEEVKADWGKQPVALTLADIPLQEDLDADEELNAMTDPMKARLAEATSTLQRVIALREHARGAATAAVEDAEKAARLAEALGEGELPEGRDEVIDGQNVHVIGVPAEVMHRFVVPHGQGDGANDGDDDAEDPDAA
jgi:PBSX family phage portal protein